ncbi:unnamed protein product [Periconia digitata]|uniref:Uncharacterized protein n=1 Tax=Periconia digitata TaxID=1303443 RepID=A0A9W4U924_9PLEO|nr:unnamed protein product [Periconia digitata]
MTPSKARVLRFLTCVTVTAIIVSVICIASPWFRSECIHLGGTVRTSLTRGTWYTALLVFATFLAFSLVGERRRREFEEREGDRAWFNWVWDSPRWIVVAGLCELFLLKAVPFGFWGAAEGRSLQEWPNKNHLRRLLRMGIIPLHIQEGGLETRNEEGGWYVQSKKQACFSFMVPDETEARNEHQLDRILLYNDLVKAIRRNGRGYRVCVSKRLRNGSSPRPLEPPRDGDEHLEVGASSWTELSLPFQKDTVLQEAKGSQDVFEDLTKEQVPRLLLGNAYYRVIVRGEAPGYEKARLDQWVCELADDAGVEEIWDADEMRSRTVRWCRHLSLKVPRQLRPPPRP